MFHLDDDNEFDKVSKTAADSYEAPYHPNWEALQRRLEAELPVKKEKRRRWLFFIFLFASLLAGGSVLWMRTRSTRNIAPVIVAKNNQTATSVAPSGNEPISLSKDVNRPTAEKTAPDPDSVVYSDKKEKYNLINLNNKQIERAPGVSKINAKQPVNSNQHPVTTIIFGQPDTKFKKEIATAGNTKEKPSIVVSRFSSKNKKVRINPSSPAPVSEKIAIERQEKASTVIVKEMEIPEVAVSENDKFKSSDNAIITTPPNEIKNSADSVLPMKETKTPKETGANDKKNRSTSSKAFSIAFVTGTDISTIKYKYGNKPGLHAGILAGFHFNKKWSVHSGIIYTQNNYKLKGSDYHPPKHYWTQYVKLETVEGYCRMWEIPIQLRYVLNASASNKWFVSGGVSSYLMKKQQYEYVFNNNLGITDKRTWQTDSSSNYMLSILHLSAGWEKSLGKRLNLQIEPYAKMPLKGVGFGNIRLSSFGMNFS